MAPRTPHSPRKTPALAAEAYNQLTERTALLIEWVEKTLTIALTSLHKERYELQEFASQHLGHVTPEKSQPNEAPTQSSAKHRPRNKKKPS